jgi:pyrrolidone-carboxylate peptidase
MRALTKNVSNKAPSPRSEKTGNDLAPSAPWHALHQVLGNNGMQRLLRTRAIRAKLRVNQPNDLYEQEADRVAEHVMRMPAPGERKETPCAACAGGGSPCSKCAARDAMVQRRVGDPGSGRANASAPDNLLQALGPGRPLDSSARAYFEPRFGYDFSHVKVHSDTRAAESARSVDALAYTVGSNVVFGAGQYAPASSDGRRLLAHELAHVAQQGASRRVVADEVEGSSGAAAPRPDTAALRLTPAHTGIQRQPRPPPDRNQLCYQSGQVPPWGAGECDAREPENCATFELWIDTFRRLRTFSARDTAPGGTHPIGFQVFGDQPATRPVDVPQPNQPEPPPPAIGPQAADRFIDHPTDTWVNTCLPPNLRETAYRLPTDCADIAIILRHVWLTGHHRTERYGGWVVGDAAGGARVDLAAGLIGPVGSWNVARMLNPYSDADGQPLRTFAELQNLLHPGDVLVWEHHSAGLGTARTGGDTETVMRVTRSGGSVTAIEVVQGDQPIFAEQASEIRQFVGRGAPSASELQHSPGRRIELHTESGLDLRDLPLPLRRGQVTPVRQWTLDDGHTTLVAAGPPQAAARPQARRVQGQTTRRISDWFGALQTATRDTLHGVFEAALLELRALIENGQAGLDADATALGRTAGEGLWNLARAAGDLGEESHFRPLLRMRALIAALGDPRGQGSGSAATPQSAAVERVFNLTDEAFHLAARGATTLDFTRRVPRGATLVRTLVTGFDPFMGGTGPVPAGVINPSGAAALALDNTTVAAGPGVTAAVEGIVLPVSFDDFRRGMVENIVRPLVQSRDVDAILTVSLDESIASADPVRIERFVVGVHAERGQLGAIPAAPAGGLGPAIIETPAPVEDIARDTAQPARRGVPAVAQPTIGTDVTFRFPTAGMADRALTALGLSPGGRREATVSDPSALQQIIVTMQRATNGTDISFQAGGQTFQASVLSGPGGSFLSNEVSFRVLRLLREQQRLDLPSFHVHVPRATPNIGDRIPQDTSTRAARTVRQRAIAFAMGVRNRIVATLQSMIRAVATRVAPRLVPPQPPQRRVP